MLHLIPLGLRSNYNKNQLNEKQFEAEISDFTFDSRSGTLQVEYYLL
ncbi:hypothetical protein [Sporosarcina ureae]|nr:hypothetical protein [Sporosarcina ureae]